jgi:DNA-binding NarL/FixJ family response regulator
MEAASAIRVLIVAEDSARSGPIGDGLGAHEDLEIVGEVSSFGEAIQLVGELSPDLVIFMGVSPLRSWMRFATWLSESRPGIEILWVEQPEHFLAEARQAKAPGTLVREGDDLAGAIRMALETKTVISRLTRTLIEETRPLDRLPKGPLSRREIEILQRVAYGSTTKEIADSLSIAPHAVATHLERIFEKLGASDRAQAVAAAIHQGLVE